MKKRVYRKKQVVKFSYVQLFLLSSVVLLGVYLCMWAFFQRVWVSGIVCLIACPMVFWKLRRSLIARFNRRLEKEFADILVVFSGSLTAGLGLEACIREIAEQPSREYPILSKEFARMEQLLRLNWPVERIFEDLAERCDHPDLRLFSTVLHAGIPAGVNLVELVRQITSTLRMKQDTEAEITRILNLPKYNNRIIMAMPVVSVIAIRWMAPSYAAGLEDGIGFVILVAACCLLGFAFLLGELLGRVGY